MKRQLQLFISPDDEIELSCLLQSEFPDIIFLNGNVWSYRPECRSGIESCESGIGYLFNGTLDKLPTITRADGRLEGPVAGCVVQVLRPKTDGGLLLSGRVAAGYDDADSDMRDFVGRVWKCVRALGKEGVIRPDRKLDKHYLVGRNAASEVIAGRYRLADRAVRLLYELPSE